ncbi:MAG: DUF87 domain-containing protein, partial [Methanosarcinaceae archaeon]|nr:DUF87 domain-containing protein [Methanosarcinaceae archaeon]
MIEGSKKNPESSYRATVAAKERVLGNDENPGEGRLFLGNYLALDRSKGAAVFLDALKPHALLICGKRGYGKSYTMGCILEELALLPPHIRKNLAALVIDTMGVFWTMRYPGRAEKQKLEEWKLFPAGFELEVFVPAGKAEEYEKRDIKVRPFSISLSELSGSQWCGLFNIEEVSPVGVLVVRTIDLLREKEERTASYSFEDISATLLKDKRSGGSAKGAAENYFRAMASWGIFAKEGVKLEELVRGGRVTVLDVSSFAGEKVCAAVVSILAGKLYEKRIEARRAYEKKLMEASSSVLRSRERENGGENGENGEDGEKYEEEFPMPWLCIDEAHLFLPGEGKSLASGVLLNNCLRQGRQPGLSLVLATQRPSSLHGEVISQSDLIIC